MMQKREVELTGLSPLLMHRYPMEPVKAIEKKTKEEQAEIAAYRTPDGELYVPGIAVQRALVGGATYVKGKGRASLQKTAAACLIVSPEYILLGQSTYDIDARPVVVPSTRGRIVRYRPRFEKWKIAFTLEFDDELMSEDQLRQVVDATCSRVGFLDFRPACKGPFGRAIVTSWNTNGAG